jgi:hypothetical protein
MYAHGLGVGVNDYVDYLIHSGLDVPAGQEYQITFRFNVCVDNAAGVATPGTFAVLFYKLDPSSYASTSSFILQTTGTANYNVPGVVQNVVVGPFANVKAGQNRSWLVRIKNGTGGGALPAGSLRILNVSYALALP